MGIKNIKDRRLSLVLADFQRCRKCQVVDRDQYRQQYGHKCSKCGAESEGGMMYFELSILILIDLIQESFHTENPNKKLIKSSHDVSVVLYFCTLREVLLNNFIFYMCLAQKIPRSIYKRLLADNSTYTLRQNHLLPSITGKKWKTHIDEASHVTDLDFSILDKFMQKAARARNKFTHEGKHWGIDRTLAEECIDNIHPLLTFYVTMHNSYVHPYFYR